MIDKQLISDTERAHYVMQLSSYFSELTDAPGIRYAYTDKLTDLWYNQAYGIIWDSDGVDSLIANIENYFDRRDRLPCIYITPAVRPQNLAELLEKKGYEKFEGESWMFYDFGQLEKPTKTSSDISVQEVKTEKDLDNFCDVYRLGLPGPEVELYIQAVREGFIYKPPLVSMVYCIGYFKGQPAGIASWLKVGEFAGAYAIATIDKFQGNGVARALVQHMGQVSKNEGAKYLFLQTETGEESETIFKKLGFEMMYVRDGYTRKENIESLQHG